MGLYGKVDENPRNRMNILENTKPSRQSSQVTITPSLFKVSDSPEKRMNYNRQAVPNSTKMLLESMLNQREPVTFAPPRPQGSAAQEELFVKNMIDDLKRFKPPSRSKRN